MPAILRTLFPDLDLSFHSKSSLIFRKSHSMATELHKRLEHQVSVTTNDVSWALCFYHSRVGTVKSAVRTDVRCGKGGDTEISPVDAASDGAEVGVAVGSAVRWSLGDNRMGHHSKVNLIIYNTHDILSWFLVVSRCHETRQSMRSNIDCFQLLTISHMAAVSHQQHTTIIEKVDIHLPFHIEAHFPDAHIHRSNPIPVQLQSIQLTCSLEEWHWSLLQRWCSTWTRQIPLLIHREVSWLSSPCPIQIYICQRNVHLNLNMAEDVKMPDYASSVMKSLVPV